MAQVGLGSLNDVEQGVMDRFFMRKDWTDKQTQELHIQKEVVIIYDLPRVVHNHELTDVSWVINTYTKKEYKKYTPFYLKCNKDEYGICVACKQNQLSMKRGLIPVVHIQSWADKKTGEVKRKGVKKFLPLKGNLAPMLHKVLGQDYSKWIGVQLEMGRSDAEMSPACGDSFEWMNRPGSNKPAGEELLKKIEEKFDLNLAPIQDFEFDDLAMLTMNNEKMDIFLKQVKNGDNGVSSSSKSVDDDNLFGTASIKSSPNEINDIKEQKVNNNIIEDDDIPF